MQPHRIPNRWLPPLCYSLATCLWLVPVAHAQVAPTEPTQHLDGENSTTPYGEPRDAAPQKPAPPSTATLTRRWTRLENAQPADPRNAALLAFKIEQCRLWQGALQRLTGWEPAEYLEAYAKAVDRAEELLAAKGDAAMDLKQSFHERAYFAANDGSAQPYWVALPPGYSAKKKWPLLVFLHGYTPEVSKLNAWIPPIEEIEAAQKGGFIMAIPYGRRNTDFVQVGEDDLLAVRDLVEHDYSVDSSRIFLIGASMGGYGVWAAGLHTPGRWLAIAPICARTDFYLWFKLERDKVEPWKRLLYDADDPLHLVNNTRNVPVFFQHGSNDIVVPVEHSRRMAAEVAKTGPPKLPVTYREDPLGDHYWEFQTSAFARAVNWLATQRKALLPRAITLVTGDLKEARAHWAQVLALKDYGLSGRLDVTLQDGNKLEVRTNNVASFALAPPASLLKAGRPITLTVDGAPQAGSYASGQPVTWQYEGAATQKSPTRCGPFKNAFRAPFLLVYGDENDRAAAERFQLEWWVYADGLAPIKAASEVKETDKANYNLVLFGTRETNPLLRAIADDLPLELTPTGYRIGSKQVAGANLGLRMVWKSPWSNERSIVVQSGLWWGGALPPNHLWDLLPDYMVYGKDLDPSDSTQKSLEAGYFDGNWALPDGK